MQLMSSEGEWARGWRLVAASFIGVTIINLHSATIGMLVQPLHAAFGWSRAQASSSILIITMVMFVSLPFIGLLLRRIDPWRLANGGLLLFCATLVGVGFSGPSVWTWYLAWAFVGVAYSAGSTLVWTTLISRNFTRQRGLALSVTVSGLALSTFVTSLAGGYVLERFGWRWVYFGLSGLGLVLLLVMNLVRGRTPTAPPQMQDEAVTHADRAEVRAVLTSWRYWRFVLALILTSLGLSVIFYHFQAMLKDGGLTTMQAAGFASLAGPGVLIGRLGGGFLLDRLPPRLMGVVFFALPAVPALMLVDYGGSLPLAAVSAVVVGATLGVEGDVSAYLTSRYFGVRNYSVAFGVMSSFSAIMFGVGPVLAGAVFDVFGSYRPMLQLLAVGLVLSGGLVASLGRAPPLTHPEA